MTGAQSGSVALPAPHGGRLTERLVAADQVEALAAQAARLPAVPWTAAAWPTSSAWPLGRSRR